jgi:peptidoglycan hydrolase CwlO-like protein
MKKAFFFITLSTFYFLLSTFVLAESCSTSCPDNDLDKCMAECQKLINISVGATKPHEQTAAALEKDIADIDANIKILATLIEKKKAVIEEGNLKFATQQTLLDSQIRDFYKKNWTSPAEYFLATIFSTEEVGQTLNNLAYRQNLIDQQKKFITSLVAELSNLNTQKKQLEENQNWLEGYSGSHS